MRGGWGGLCAGGANAGGANAGGANAGGGGYLLDTTVCMIQIHVSHTAEYGRKFLIFEYKAD